MKKALTECFLINEITSQANHLMIISFFHLTICPHTNKIVYQQYGYYNYQPGRKELYELID